LLLLLPHIWNVPHFLRIYELSLCHDAILHSGNITWTYILVSLLLDHLPYSSFHICMVCFCQIKLTSSQTRISYVQFTSILSRLSWTFLMTYSKVRKGSHTHKNTEWKHHKHCMMVEEYNTVYLLKNNFHLWLLQSSFIYLSEISTLEFLYVSVSDCSVYI